MSRRRVLLISYGFPPRGGSGVQRTLKYAKYLPSYGWKPYVISVKDIVSHVYDPKLLTELSQDVTVLRTESLDPARLTARFLTPFRRRHRTSLSGRTVPFFGQRQLLNAYRILRDWFLFPDAAVGWILFALSRGVETVREHNIDIIVASVGPYTSALLAAMISRRTRVPFVLDFRDGWTDYPYLGQPTPLHAWGHRRLESRVVQQAEGICVYGEFLRNRLEARYPRVADRLEVITNGYDPEDFERTGPAPKSRSVRRIVYSGGVYSRYETHFDGLLRVLEGLPDAVRESLEVLFVGQMRIPDVHKRIAAAHLEDQVRIIGYQSHLDCISYLLSADACLLFLPEADKQAYSGKVFEYLRAGCPIIACVEPNGACADLLRSVGQADYLVAPGDDVALRDALERLAAARWPRTVSRQLEQFSRQRLTEKLVALMERVLRRNEVVRTSTEISNSEGPSFVSESLVKP